MFINIQMLRFIAAMLVVVYHTAARIPEASAVSHQLFGWVETLGFAGVDIFFVISGYIMVYTTRGRAGPEQGQQFMRRRIARIFSGYWPFFFAAWLVFAVTRPEHLAESHLLKSFLLWPQSLNLVLLEITWTLSFEMYFYVMFALLVAFTPIRARTRVLLLTTFVLLAYNIHKHFVVSGFSAENMFSYTFYQRFLTSPFLLEFLSGALLAQWLENNRLPMSRLWLLAGATLFCAGGLVNAVVYSGLIEQGYHVFPRVLVFGIPSLLLVAGMVAVESDGYVAHRRFSIQAGGASYAIYLSHVLILGLAWHLGLGTWLSGFDGFTSFFGYILVMALIFAISLTHYLLLEKRLHSLFKRWLILNR
jgi:peptidoglycan/LPS O-acetylase OafA/YrhL